MEAWYLGVDGGGTSTRAVIVDAEGRERGRGNAGSANPAAAGFDTAVANIRQAVAQAARAGGQDAALAGAWYGLAGVYRAGAGGLAAGRGGRCGPADCVHGGARPGPDRAGRRRATGLSRPGAAGAGR